MSDSSLKDATRDDILERLSDGESLSEICERAGMPSRKTVQRWMADDEQFHDAVTRARESGYLIRGERAVSDAKRATDAQLGRLAFDAERWFLGKLSNAFSDKQKIELSGKLDWTARAAEARQRAGD